MQDSSRFLHSPKTAPQSIPKRRYLRSCVVTPGHLLALATGRYSPKKIWVRVQNEKLILPIPRGSIHSDNEIFNLFLALSTWPQEKANREYDSVILRLQNHIHDFSSTFHCCGQSQSTTKESLFQLLWQHFQDCQRTECIKLEHLFKFCADTLFCHKRQRLYGCITR